MIGFGGYLLGWFGYIVCTLGFIYFLRNLFGKFRNYLIVKLMLSIVAAFLLAPWHVIDVEVAYWAPAAVVGLVQSVKTTPQEALIHIKPMAILLAVFWSLVLLRYFVQKRKVPSAAAADS